MKKKKKIHRLENSNIIVQMSDQESCAELSSSSSENQIIFEKRNKNKKKSRRDSMAQCFNCAGYHEIADCPRPRHNSRQQQFENLRSRFAAAQYKYHDFVDKNRK